MNVYVIRHGQTYTNLNRWFCGWYDVSLTPKGEEDAAMASRLLAGINFDRIYASDLLRARQTAQIALPGCEPVLRPCLREMSVGAFTGHPVTEIEQEYGETCTYCRTSRDFSPVGGESHQMQYERVIGIFPELESLENVENVAVFCHEGTVKCFLSYVLGYPIDPTRLRVDNGSVSTFSYTDGKWRLLSWNKTE